MKQLNLKGWIASGCMLWALFSPSIADAQTVHRSTHVLIRSFRPEGNTLISTQAIQALFERYLGIWPIPKQGMWITPAKLRSLLEATLGFYLQLGHSGIYVYIPQESVERNSPLSFKNDTLQMKIVEGKVARLNTTYRAQKKWLRSLLVQKIKEKNGGEEEESSTPDSHEKRRAWIRRWVPIETGQHIRKKDLESFADFLERHPGRSVAAVVKKIEGETSSEEVGSEVAVEIRVLDADPLTFYGQLSNTGSDSTEEYRFRLGLVHNNLIGRDDIFNADLQASADDSPQDNYGLFFSYDAPLWTPLWRGRVYAAYNEFESSDILGPGTSFIGEGFAFGEEVRYNIWQKDGWFLDVFQGFDFQNSEVKTPFGFSSDVNLFDITVGARLERNKPDYQASLEAKITYNLTEAFDLSDDVDFDNSRNGTKPGYAIFSLRGNHRRSVRNGIALYQQFGAQISGNRLVSAKEISIGGLNTVRGYEEFEVLGDRGIFLSTEPRLSLNTLFPSMNKLPFSTDLIPIFLDIGYVSIKDAITGENSSTTILSLGAGARFYYKDLFFARTYYGRALKDAGNGPDDTKSGDDRFHLDLTLRF